MNKTPPKPYVCEDSPVPPSVAAALSKFLADAKTGNFTINVKDGKIMGARCEELIRV
jgi:hypothetical protein